MSPKKDADNFHARGIDKLFELSDINANDDTALVVIVKDTLSLVVECARAGSSEYWGWIGRFCLGIEGKRGLSYPVQDLPSDPPNQNKGDREFADWIFKRTTNLYQQIQEGSRLKGDEQRRYDDQFVNDCNYLAGLAKRYLGEK